MKKIILSTVAVLSSLVLLNSCTLDNNNTTQPQSGAFLIAQISPTAPSINVFVNNSTFDTGMLFGNYTPYVSATPGTYTVNILASGSGTPSLTSTVAID